MQAIVALSSNPTMFSSRSSYYPDSISHHHNANAGIEFYRRSEGGTRMPLGHNSSLLQNHYGGERNNGQVSRRTTPSSTDNESRHSNGPPRKRVSVACERCRKRKIKCSGDESGGGCSNCRSVGLSGCHFHRVATIPDATTYMAYRQEMRSRAHVDHWHQPQHGHMQRYSPYSMPAPSHQYNRQPSATYASYSSNPPTSYGQHTTNAYVADYTTPYSTGVSQGVSWTRTGSYSGYHGYEIDASATATTDSYPTQLQPASFLLPNTDPMGSTTNAGYKTTMNPYGRSNSQIWAEHGLLNNAYGGEAGSDHAPTVYEGPMHVSPANHASDAAIPYPLITSTSSLNNSTTSTSGRTLPTPGGRTCPHSQQPLACDNLPLSAVSHRSSIGWSTDSGSGASHVSSQTSLTASTPGGHEHGSGRSVTRHGGHDSQELDYSYVAFNNSSPISLPNGNFATAEETTSDYKAIDQSGYKNTSLTTAVTASPSSMAHNLPSHHQRCRSVSQESTPVQQSNVATIPSNTAANKSTGSKLSISDTVRKSSNSRTSPEDGVTTSCPSYTGKPYSEHHSPNANAPHSSHVPGTRSGSDTTHGPTYPFTSPGNHSGSTIEAALGHSSPDTSIVGNYRAHLNIGGYTTAPHLASTSSFVRTDLVVPSPQSQTRGATTSGGGAARLTAVSSALPGYTSARGSDAFPSSILSNLGGGGDGLSLGLGYGTDDAQYGNNIRVISGASMGLTGGRGDSGEYSAAAVAPYARKELIAEGGGIIKHSTEGSPRMGRDTGSMIEY